METTQIFQKKQYYVATFLIIIKKLLDTIVIVAMVTNMTKDTKWHTLCHLVSSPLKGTLCHLVSCGGTKWQNDTNL